MKHNYQNSILSKTKLKKIKYEPRKLKTYPNIFENIFNIYDVSPYNNICFLQQLKKFLISSNIIEISSILLSNFVFCMNDIILWKKYSGKTSPDIEYLSSKISEIETDYNSQVISLMKTNNIFFPEDLSIIHTKLSFPHNYKDREDFIRTIKHSMNKISAKRLERIQILEAPRDLIEKICSINMQFVGEEIMEISKFLVSPMKSLKMDG